MQALPLVPRPLSSACAADAAVLGAHAFPSPAVCMCSVSVTCRDGRPGAPPSAYPSADLLNLLPRSHLYPLLPTCIARCRLSASLAGGSFVVFSPFSSFSHVAYMLACVPFRPEARLPRSDSAHCTDYCSGTCFHQTRCGWNQRLDTNALPAPLRWSHGCRRPRSCFETLRLPTAYSAPVFEAHSLVYLKV